MQRAENWLSAITNKSLIFRQSLRGSLCHIFMTAKLKKLKKTNLVLILRSALYTIALLFSSAFHSSWTFLFAVLPVKRFRRPPLLVFIGSWFRKNACRGLEPFSNGSWDPPVLCQSRKKAKSSRVLALCSHRHHAEPSPDEVAWAALGKIPVHTMNWQIIVFPLHQNSVDFLI